jgi:hypothetical protein
MTSPLRLTTSNFILWLNTCSYSPYLISSLMRAWVHRLQLLLVLASAVILRSESRRTHDHILLSQIWDSPNLEGQVPVFMSPRNMVAWLYTQALGSLFIASYNSQGYSGGVQLHDLVLIWTAAYAAHRYPRKCLLITCIPGHACWFHSNELVSFPRNGSTCHNILLCLVQSSTLKMEAADSFKILITMYQTTKHHILDDSNLLSNSYCINLKAHYFNFSVISHELSASISRVKGTFNQKNQGTLMFC